MNIRILLIAICFIVFSASIASAVDKSAFNELIVVMDSAKVMEAPVFAPRTWVKATKTFEKASKEIQQHKKQKNIDKAVSEAREYVENAIRATEVGKLSLQEYIEARQKANDAKARSLVPALYAKAEVQFIKATEKVESGNVKNALKEAQKASPLFLSAEMEAIRKDILGKADRLIEKALADDAGKFALSTLDKAKTARLKANTIISRDRYNRKEASEEASRAAYEARHASNIALSVRALNRNDQAWEKLMLIYEIQMNRIGKNIGLEHLPFDNGPLAAADTLIMYINNLQSENERLNNQMSALSGNVTAELQALLSQFDETTDDSDPIKLTNKISKHIETLITENKSLSEQIQSSQSQLATLEEEHGAVAGQLASRVEREEKFKKAKQMLNPSEGEILFNSSNDVVLRLSGLSFDVNKSEIKDSHMALLEKVKETIQMFPDALIRVEGHTDDKGEASRNVLLSEKRALAVMQYLRQSLLISASKISSVGYGADHPVASNQTEAGRAKNRRIDIILMQ